MRIVEDADADLPRWRRYMADPSRENAILFLQEAGIGIPYEALRAQQHANVQTDPRPKRTKYRGGGHNLSRLDAIKDLLSSAVAPRALLEQILADTTWTEEEKQKILAWCRSDRQGVARRFANHIMNIGYIHVEGPRISLHEDHHLYQAVVGWVAGRARVEICLDGVLRACVPGTHERDIVASLLVFAFVGILLGDLGDVGFAYVDPDTRRTWSVQATPRTPGATSVVFVVGPMTDIDHPTIQKFLTAWIGEMEVWANWADRVSIERVGAVPSDPRFAFSKDGKHLVVDGVWKVPIGAAVHRPPVARAGETDAAYFDRCIARLSLPYPKSYLETLVVYADMPGEDRTEERQAAFRRLLDLNFFRDSFYIDVALQRGAVYMTMDRLALVQYLLRAPAGAPGFFLAPAPADSKGVAEAWIR